MHKHNQAIIDLEIWHRWVPNFDRLIDKYNFKRLDDKIDTLNIFLISITGNQKLKICFKSAWAHRNSYESFRMHLIAQLSERYGSEFYTKWSFFKIENSNYLKWLSAESSGWTDMLNLNHFVIMGIDFIVDVVAAEEPTFKILIK